MRYRFVLPLLLLLFMGITAAVSSAQDELDSPPMGQAVNVEGLPGQMIDGVSERSVESTNLQSLPSPRALSALPPGDNCEGAPLLVLTPGINEGVSADIASLSEGSTDPELACMLGEPTRKKGYRTAWYELSALPYNRVLLDTFSSGYDTVVAVYKGTCGDLEMVACNDDTVQFTSQLLVHIDDLSTTANGTDERYYVEIADWNAGLSPDPTLRLSAIMDPVISEWATIVTKPIPFISRHAVVSHGKYVYVVGGQTGGEGLPQISNQLLRLDTESQEWAPLNQIPGVGYSNTTAVFLNDAIYLPSGYNGNDLGYDGLHWKYDINRNSWNFLGSLPKKVGWAAAAARPSRQLYYLTGGMTSTVPGSATASVSDQVYRYIQSTNTWETLTNRLQNARYAHTAAWVNNQIGLCVAGGLGTAKLEDGTDVAILWSSVECSLPGDEWANRGDLQIPRYGAGSVVGPDGKWYVFGGRDANHIPVAQTEVYNPATNTFALMEPEYDLGRYDTLPARFWPRGAMVGNELWVIGGSIQEDGSENALAAIDRLNIPTANVFLPFTSTEYDDATRPDDSFATARQMGFGGQQQRNFDQQFDFYDFYTFDLTGPRRVTIDLEVPENNDFNLDLYGQNKLLWGSSRNPRQGIDEHISLFLQPNQPPRRYYIMVSRAYPTSQPDKGASYTLKLN